MIKTNAIKKNFILKIIDLEIRKRVYLYTQKMEYTSFLLVFVALLTAVLPCPATPLLRGTVISLYNPIVTISEAF